MAIVGIVPEHAYDSATYGSNPIGSGRYVLKQWDRGQQVILEANPDYYGQAPTMERVTILFMEEDAAFLAAQAGQVDVAYTSATYSNESVEGYSLAAYQAWTTGALTCRRFPPEKPTKTVSPLATTYQRRTGAPGLEHRRGPPGDD